MLRQLSLLLAGLAAVQASGKFAVLHSPESVEFNVNGEIEQSVLKEILSAALGYTGKQKDTEHSIAIWDPFSMPKALVAMPIEGIEMLSFIKDKAKVEYAMIFDEAEETTWQAIRSRVEERSNDNALVRINLSDGVDALGQSALGELKPANIEKLTVLNSEIEEDRKFIEEMQLLNAIADNASSTKKHDSGTDVYWIVVSALKPVLDLHGNNSEAAKEAYTLLNDAMERTSKAFVNAYDGKVVIAAFTNDASKVRNARSVLLERRSRETDAPRDDEQDQQINKKEEEDVKNKMHSTTESDTIDSTTERSSVQNDSWTSDKSDLDSVNKELNTNTQTIGQPEFSGRAKTYTEDYPVIFNIILWFGVIFVFSLLVICIAIGDMDPGRDSIIYRMTSNRMKKDN
ncbi:ATPase H(+)-transporting accessory protein 2 isoform X2 [Odontomachus brunneus]|uniref:ATPase H(+)-transporting accessory protein 2 isoform X2 n=1 Tax=Odontomachus brunneus TaxID=486640 RepID=UPI0013F1E7B0|nr:ATPase H(+)-transporting accessory protein 2 isoform X2 [Odontomachus brunneus]